MGACASPPLHTSADSDPENTSLLVRPPVTLQSGVFSILSSVYVGEFNSTKLAVPLAKVVKHL